MKNHSLVIIAVILLVSCDVHYQKTWVIRNAPIGSERSKIVRNVISRESKNVGLKEVVMSHSGLKYFYQINENKESVIRVIDMVQYENTIVVDLNSGFNSNIGKDESFSNFCRKIDECFKVEIGKNGYELIR